MIVVTGATGKLGRKVVAGLLEKLPANEVVAAVRSPEKAADLGALRGDLNDSSDDLRRLIGRPTTLLADAVAEALAQH